MLALRGYTAAVTWRNLSSLWLPLSGLTTAQVTSMPSQGFLPVSRCSNCNKQRFLCTATSNSLLQSHMSPRKFNNRPSYHSNHVRRKHTDSVNEDVKNKQEKSVNSINGGSSKSNLQQEQVISGELKNTMNREENSQTEADKDELSSREKDLENSDTGHVITTNKAESDSTEVAKDTHSNDEVMKEDQASWVPSHLLDHPDDTDDEDDDFSTLDVAKYKVKKLVSINYFHFV